LDIVPEVLALAQVASDDVSQSARQLGMVYVLGCGLRVFIGRFDPSI
jgi:hypothetical protein